MTFQGNYLLDGYKKVLSKDYISVFEHNLGPEKASKILEVYGIKADMDSNLFLARSIALGGDILLSGMF